MRTYFTSQMRGDYLPFGGCYTTDDHRGAAIWGPAGKPLLTGIAGIKNLVKVMPYVISHLKTTLQLISLIESMHPHEPHWYLATLGPIPRRRAGASARRSCARSWTTAMPRAGRRTWSRRRSATSLLRPPRLRRRQGGAAPGGGPEHLDDVARRRRGRRRA